jgi:hypothetical protein
MEVELVWQHNATWDWFLVKYRGYSLARGLWHTFDELKTACPTVLYEYMNCPGRTLHPETSMEAAHIKMLRTLQQITCPVEKREEVKALIDCLSCTATDEDEDAEDIPPIMLHRQHAVSYTCTVCATDTSNDCRTCAHCHNVECATHLRYMRKQRGLM